jgi:hypothetical protein
MSQKASHGSHGGNPERKGGRERDGKDQYWRTFGEEGI